MRKLGDTWQPRQRRRRRIRREERTQNVPSRTEQRPPRSWEHEQRSPSVRPAAFSRPRGPANVQTDRRRPPDSSPRLRGLPLGHSASHRPIPDPSRYGAGLKEVGARSLALISNVGYVDLEKWSHWPRLRRGEQRPHKEMGEERGEGEREGGAIEPG